MKALNVLFWVCLAGTFGAVIWMSLGLLIAGNTGWLIAAAFSTCSLFGLITFLVLSNARSGGRSSGYEAPDCRD